MSVIALPAGADPGHSGSGPAEHAGRWCWHRRLAERGSAGRPDVNWKRHHPHQLWTMAAHGGSTAAGNQMDQNQIWRSAANHQDWTERVEHALLLHTHPNLLNLIHYWCLLYYVCVLMQISGLHRESVICRWSCPHWKFGGGSGSSAQSATRTWNHKERTVRVL